MATDTRLASALTGYVPDQPYLYDKLSGREFLQFVAQMHGLDDARRKRSIDREIERFELAEFVDELTESYSHGMKQRMVFAAALLHSPRCWSSTSRWLASIRTAFAWSKDLLQAEVAAGMCVLMSTHTLAAAEEISDRIGIMSHGRLMFDGTMDDLRKFAFQANHSSLESMYLAMTEGTSAAVRKRRPVPGNVAEFL